jgi:hypothetical protein
VATLSAAPGGAGGRSLSSYRGFDRTTFSVVTWGDDAPNRLWTSAFSSATHQQLPSNSNGITTLAAPDTSCEPRRRAAASAACAAIREAALDNTDDGDVYVQDTSSSESEESSDDDDDDGDAVTKPKPSYLQQLLAVEREMEIEVGPQIDVMMEMGPEVDMMMEVGPEVDVMMEVGPEVDVERDENEAREFARLFVDEIYEAAPRGLASKRPRLQAGKIAVDAMAHPVFPGRHCPQTCRQKCHDIISIEEQRRINREYWSMSFNDRAKWRFGMLVQEPVKLSRRVGEGSRRKLSTFYNFPSSEGTVRVCKKFVLTTMGYSHNNDQCLKQTRSIPLDVAALPEDKRGSTPSVNKVNRQRIKDHIESFKPPYLTTDVFMLRTAATLHPSATL